MAWEFATGAGSVLSSLISGIFGSKSQRDANATNLQIARETNQMSLDAMRENNAFNRQMAIDMFNMENAYNSPVEQIKRLREAGINPAVALGGNATSIANTGETATPSASGNPSLAFPHVEPVPNFLSGAINTLLQLSQLGLNKSATNKNNAETYSLYKTVEAEVKQKLADAKYKEAMTEYQNIQSSLDVVFGSQERAAKCKKLVADYFNSLVDTDYKKAEKYLAEAETALKNAQEVSVREQLPQIVENLKKTGQKIVADTQASKAAAHSSEAAANASNAAANKANEEAQTIKENRINVVELSKLQVREQKAHTEVAESTTMQQIEHWKNMVKLDERQQKELEQLIIKAKKENSWIHVEKIVNLIKSVFDIQDQQFDNLRSVVPFLFK